MANPPLSLEHAHAIDAPHADYETWLDGLRFGICTACGHDAWHGTAGWWHADGRRLCPDRGKRAPMFSADVPDD